MSRAALRTRVVLVFSFALACEKKHEATAGGDAAATSPSVAIVAAPPSASARPFLHTALGPGSGEAPVHFVVDRASDPVLRPYASRIAAHFKDSKAALQVQRASLQGGGWASLVSEVVSGADKMPLLLVEDRERRLLWEKERPTAAMLPPVRDPVIVGRGEGGVALFTYDVPARVVAGRLLDADGTPFTDINVIRADDCQRMTAAFWPRRGLVVVCARPRGSLLQIVRDDYTLAMPNDGAPIGVAFRAPAPVSIGFDSQSTMMLAQYADGGGKDVVVVMRYDATGRPLWHEPRKVAEVTRVATPAPRIGVSELSNGIRLSVPGSPERAFEITSDGAIRGH